MKQRTKYAATERAIERTMAQVRQLLARKDVREMSLQSSGRGTRFTIKVNTKVYNFWLAGASGLIAFSRVLQEQITCGKARAEHYETP
jgi:hypothetical protein